MTEYGITRPANRRKPFIIASAVYQLVYAGIFFLGAIAIVFGPLLASGGYILDGFIGGFAYLLMAVPFFVIGLILLIKYVKMYEDTEFYKHKGGFITLIVFSWLFGGMIAGGLLLAAYLIKNQDAPTPAPAAANIQPALDLNKLKEGLQRVHNLFENRLITKEEAEDLKKRLIGYFTKN